MTDTATTTEQKIADAMRRLSATLQKQYEKGERTGIIYLDDLTETLLSLADEIDPE